MSGYYDDVGSGPMVPGYHDVLLVSYLYLFTGLTSSYMPNSVVISADFIDGYIGIHLSPFLSSPNNCFLVLFPYRCLVDNYTALFFILSSMKKKLLIFIEL